MRTGIVGTWLIAIAPLLASMARGQTLNEILLKEDPAGLASQAREGGDIVRGAILFHQGNINCAKCHRAAMDQARIGPDLSRMDPQTTDIAIVESILQPSKKIQQGFETFNVLTVQGGALTGQLVSQDEQKLVLRSGQNIDQLITIPRKDVELMQTASKSIMPDELANELKDRRQFLDLLRYVIDLKERGPTADQADSIAATQRQLSAEVQGWALMQNLNCTACHLAETVGLPAVRGAPDLKWSAKWLNRDYLIEFLNDPGHVKPGTSMPNLLGQLPADARQTAAEALVHYCASLVDGPAPLSAAEPSDGDAVGRGQELFHSIGCVACHAPRDAVAMEQPAADFIPLGDLAGKYNQAALTAFLEDPHAVRPSGRMPDMLLTHREALELSDYLLQSRHAVPGNEQPAWSPSPGLVEQGQRLFEQLQCGRCHSGLKSQAPSGTFPALAELRHDQGCLSDQPGRWPEFQLSAADRQHVQAALRSTAETLSDAQKIDVSLAAFNCFACHSRDGAGGVTEDRNSYFQTTNLNLGDQGRIPPTLSGVGAKLNAQWMRDVLVNHRTIRPYMKTRMPQYGQQNIGHLTQLFQQTDSLPETKFAAFDDQKEMRQFGLELAGNKGLNCVACHTYQYKPSDTMPAVDLTEMGERLKKDWFFQYLLAPQKFSPNTVMPSYWPNGNAIRSDLAGDATYQIEALWQYLLDGRQANAPSGVIQKPLEIVVTDEAQMLRRSYEGVGKRGIGVGYPGGVNLVFDAEQMRLATIWKGKFANPAGVWYGQGHGMVRPLGPPLHFPKGPDLDYLDQPWRVDDGRPPHHQFLGYVLDVERRPTFRYRLDNIEIRDACKELTDDASGSTQLQRSLTLTSEAASAPVRFRVAAAADIQPLADRLFRGGQTLTIRIVSNHAAEIVAEDDQLVLLIRLDISDAQPDELLINYLWE